MEILYDETYASNDGGRASRNLWYGDAGITAEGEYGVVIRLNDDVRDSLCEAIKKDLSKNAFEAMEAVTGKTPEIADLEWLKLAEGFITSKSNNLKREASRVVGNIAHLFPDDLESAISSLMVNTKNDGTVIRWGSAYALARIIQIPRYASSGLFDALTELAEHEQENGVKNQLLGGLKKQKS